MANQTLDLPNKKYFTIGEVSSICNAKPHVLRYWEKEFHQLQPIKRRGNRRFYQRKDLLFIAKLQDLLYKKGFTISGAKQFLEKNRQDQLLGQSQFLKILLSDLNDLKGIINKNIKN